jgi:kynureninase
VELFDEIGIEKLREKSILLTGYLEKLIDTELKGLVTIDTPREIERRGAQLSIRFCKADTDVKLLEHKLYALGVVPDARGPILRVGPAPLYNSFKDAWAFVQRLRSLLIKQ